MNARELALDDLQRARRRYHAGGYRHLYEAVDDHAAWRARCTARDLLRGDAARATEEARVYELLDNLRHRLGLQARARVARWNAEHAEQTL